MGCCQAASKAIPLVSVRKEKVTDFNFVLEVPSIKLGICKNFTSEEISIDSLPMTRRGTPEEEPGLKSAFLVNNGEFQIRVPRLLNPEAASTIIRRRRYQKLHSRSEEHTSELQ